MGSIEVESRNIGRIIGARGIVVKIISFFWSMFGPCHVGVIRIQ